MSTNPFESPRPYDGGPASGGPPRGGPDSRALISLVLGILGVPGGICCPLVGLPLCIGGMVLWRQARESESRGLAMAGFVISTIGLVLTLINIAWGAYLGATGQHPLLK